MSRNCEHCDVCCTVSRVEGANGFLKPAYNACPHIDPDSKTHKCTIFGKEDRPAVCSSFYCSWMRGYGGETDRPADNGVMVSVNNANGGTWIFVKELWKDAVVTTGKDIIMHVASTHDVPVIIVDHDKEAPDDTGDRVVIKSSIKDRSRNLMGKFLGYLDNTNQFEIYSLRTVNRTCEGCVGCCIYFEIPEIGKEQHEPCKHLKCEGFTGEGGNNCGIHDDRPQPCREYFCQWVNGRGEDDDRPDKIGIMIDNQQGINNSYTARPLWPGATETAKGVDFIERFSAEVNCPVIVINYEGTKITRLIGKGM